MNTASGNAASSVPLDLSNVQLAQAMDFAAKAHAGQTRKGERKEPYITHVTEVAQLVAEATGGRDVNLIIAAILHDTVEDVPSVTRTVLSDTFGEDVASLVNEVTDDKALSKAERKRLQVETAPSKSERAKIIKIADKIANLRSLAASPPADWSDERKLEYVQWSSRVVTGCLGVNPWLESQYQEACKSFDSPPDIRLARLRDDLAGLPVTPTYRDALLASVDRYADQILERPEHGVGYDDLFNVQQVTLGDAVEETLEKQFGAGQPIEVGGRVHQLTDRESSGVRSSFEISIRPRQIPNVVEQLKLNGKESSWVVLMFYTPKFSIATNDDCPNLQFSIQDGVLGLDWVLLGERNIADKALVASFIVSNGHTVTERELNEVGYLRAENGDLSALGQKIVEQLYGMPEDADIGVLVDGFSVSIPTEYAGGGNCN